MPIEDLYKLILQNIERQDPNDAIFELNQLNKMTQIDFTQEIKTLQDPDIMGQPQTLKEIQQKVTKQFKAYQKQN